MHTIGMDTYGLIVDGVAAAEGQVQGEDPALPVVNPW